MLWKWTVEVISIKKKKKNREKRPLEGKGETNKLIKLIKLANKKQERLKRGVLITP